MKIKQLIEEPGAMAISFYIDDNGALMIEKDGDLIEIPANTAIELIEYLRCKLIEHQQANESLLQRLLR
jgi:hypothetical protein